MDTAQPSLSTTAFLILLTLYGHRAQGDVYGLQLAEDADVARSTTYWALQRLAQRGLVSSDVEKVDRRVAGRAPRCFYRLTEAGVAEAQRVLALGHANCM